MACNCAEEVDEKLRERNTQLERPILLRHIGEDQTTSKNPNLMLRTHQIETGRGKPKAIAVFFAYCPFCGTKYNE